MLSQEHEAPVQELQGVRNFGEAAFLGPLLTREFRLKRKPDLIPMPSVPGSTGPSK